MRAGPGGWGPVANKLSPARRSREIGRMKSWLMIVSLLGAATLGAGGDFLGSITPEERTAMGLQKLAPEELARLKAVVERYKSGEVAVVQQQAAAQVAAAETKLKEAEAQVTAPVTDKKKPGWLAALITLQKTRDKPDQADAFETRIAGDFDGWTGHTTFRLENGQVWQQNGGESYSGDRLNSPRVKIYPGAFSAYWMEVEGLRQRVKVRPIRLE